MATELKLPDVGDNIEQGTVVTVLVKPGDTINAGDPIIEIETDKAVVEVPAEAGGTVEAVSVKVGDTVKVGGVIATLGGEGTSAPAGVPAASPSQGGGDQAAQAESTGTSSDGGQAKDVAQAQQAAQKEQAGTTSPASSASAAAPAAPSAQPPSAGAQITLPDVGDNIEQGTVVTVLVKEGDTVSEGQPVIEIETDKAVVEVPANAGGTVQSVAVKVGDTVKVGGVIATLGGG
ncbi:biotin/lipoyl-containing protein, partial [uncultured Deinococcus sp.]|uniref:biotin/lipoyl-containing protein n=1 Tax=uncultured Deinococcus sp. TaxID=158789 RepID=UPI0025ED53E3